MSEFPPCPECQSAYTYADAPLLICPECGHEWTDIVEPRSSDYHITAFDANGTPLTDGDTVIIIKDLKVKGASSALKIGTKVKQIRLVEGDHNIDCKIPGFGDMKLKSEFVKKG